MADSPTPTPSAPSEAEKPWPRLGWVAVPVAFLAGILNFPLQVLGERLDHLPGDGADNRLNNFILEHGYRWLRGRETNFWDAPAFYPTSGVTALSDAHIGMLPLYAGTRLFGATPEQAYQAHFLACFALNFLAAVWALRRLGFGPFGIAAGAFVFTFGLPLVGQATHTQLYPRWLVPPAVVFGWEFLGSPKASRLATTAACVVGQLYLTVYVGFMLGLLLAGGLLVTMIRFRNELPWGELRRPPRREWLKRIGVLVAAGLAVFPLLLRHGSEVRGAQRNWIREAAPVPASWLTAPNPAWLPLPRFEHSIGEHQLLMGLLPLASVLGSVVVGCYPSPLNSQRGKAAAAAWTVLVLMFLVTRIGPVWPYALFAYVPGTGGIRIPARVVLVLMFPAGLTLAWVTDSTIAAARRAGRCPIAVAAALLGLIALDQRVVPVEGHDREWESQRYPIAEGRAWQTRIAGEIAKHPNPKVVYVFPSFGLGLREPLQLQTETMRATQDLGLPCVNGWSGYPPYRWWFFPGYRSLMVWLTETNPIPLEKFEGLVLVGCPIPDTDPIYNALMWLSFPPQLEGVPPRSP